MKPYSCLDFITPFFLAFWTFPKKLLTLSLKCSMCCLSKQFIDHSNLLLSLKVLYLSQTDGNFFNVKDVFFAEKSVICKKHNTYSPRQKQLSPEFCFKHIFCLTLYVNRPRQDVKSFFCYWCYSLAIEHWSHWRHDCLTPIHQYWVRSECHILVSIQPWS